MYVEIDLSLVPPVLELREPRDFSGFKVVVKRIDSAGVRVSTLRELAGELTDDVEWQDQFERMLAYAASHDWIRDDGSIEAHVEWKR